MTTTSTLLLARALRREEILDHLRRTGLPAYVHTADSGGTVVFCADDGDHADFLPDYAEAMSRDLDCAVVMMMLVEDDVTTIAGHLGGLPIVDYVAENDLYPEMVSRASIEHNARSLATVFARPDAYDDVVRILAAPIADDAFPREADRQVALLAALGLPTDGVGATFFDFERDKMPDGSIPEHFERIN